MFFCLDTAIIYPYCTAFGGIPYNWDAPIWLNIFIGEIIMLLDIVINFLLAFKEDGDTKYNINFKKIAHKYIHEGTFKKDLIIWLPLYEIFKRIDPTLEIFVIIKSTRFS
jgi:hypothetical protein